MVFDSLRKALKGDPSLREEDLLRELGRTEISLARAQDQLESQRQARLSALFPEGPVSGAGEGLFPGLDPINFDDEESDGWLVVMSTSTLPALEPANAPPSGHSMTLRTSLGKPTIEKITSDASATAFGESAQVAP